MLQLKRQKHSAVLPLGTFICVTFEGISLERISCYQYLGIWTHIILKALKKGGKNHITELLKKLKPPLTFFYWTKSSLPQYCRRQTVQHFYRNLCWYYSGGRVYMHAASATIKPQDRLHHSAVSFNTGGGVMTRHHQLYENIGWNSGELWEESNTASCLFEGPRSIFHLFIWIMDANS